MVKQALRQMYVPRTPTPHLLLCNIVVRLVITKNLFAKVAELHTYKAQLTLIGFRAVFRLWLYRKPYDALARSLLIIHSNPNGLELSGCVVPLFREQPYASLRLARQPKNHTHLNKFN